MKTPAVKGLFAVIAAVFVAGSARADSPRYDSIRGWPIRSIDIGKTGKIGLRYRDIDDIRVQRLDLIDSIALIDIYRRTVSPIHSSSKCIQGMI